MMLNLNDDFNDYHTVVIGAGLSGISAANSLKKESIKVTILEKSARLGGRAFSYYDPSSKEHIDNGQHVIVGACKNFIYLLNDLGVQKNLTTTPNFKVPVIYKNKISFLGSNKMPGILGLFWSIITYKHLSLKDNLRIIYGVFKIFLSSSKKTAAIYPKFGDWLKQNYQNNLTKKFFWDIIIKPSVNDFTDETSTKYAFLVIKRSFIQQNKYLYIGYPSIPLNNLWEPLKEKILDSNDKLKTKAVVKKFILENNLIKYVELSNGDRIFGDFFICTIPQKDLLSILKNSNINFELPNDNLLNNAPIICVHFWFDKSIMNHSYLASTGGPTQWIFNVSKNHNDNDNHIVLSQSAAWEWIDKNKEEIKDIFLKDLEKILPNSKKSRLLKYTIIKQRNATFRCESSSEESRLFKVPQISNLNISGDWTETDWPSTMEGAIISGNLGSSEAIKFKNLKN